MTATNPDTGVYVTLDDLTRVRHQAKRFSLLPRQPVTSLLAGGHASRLRGRGLDFDEIRKYLPGDDPRAIDWKVTARTRTPHTRVYTEERERPVFVLVDQRLSMFFGTVRQMKSVVAAEAAALAAWRTLAVRDRIGGIVFNDHARIIVQPQRSQSTVLQFLNAVVEQNRALTAMSPIAPNPGMLNATLRQASQIMTHDTLLLVLTDAEGADDTTRKILTTIARHNDVVVVFVFDPLEACLPPAKTLVVTDGARQMEFDASSECLRLAYQQSFAERRAQARQFLLSRDVPVLPLCTTGEVADQVIRALGGVPRRSHG